jgi:FAD/FMN-containing dehydrogenase
MSLADVQARLGWVHADGRGARATPASFHAAMTLVTACREAGVEIATGGPPPAGGVLLDRTHLSEIGPLDEPAMWITAAAGARISDVELRLRSSGLTLGSQPPSAFRETVADFVEGPLGGRRAEAGRVAPGVVAVEALMPGGMLHRSRAAPRSAAGPGLSHLLLGGGGACGWVIAATLRAEPLASRQVVVSGSGPAAAAGALLAELTWGVAPPFSLEFQGGDPLHVECTFAGDHEDVMSRMVRATARLEALGLVTRPALGKRTPGAEVELEIPGPSLPAAIAALPAGERMQAFRVARESVIAVVSPVSAEALRGVPGLFRLDGGPGDFLGAGPELALFARIVRELRRPG